MPKNLENGIARMDLDVYRGFLLKMVRSYRYFNNNQSPDKVVIPKVDEVEGVPVVMESMKSVAKPLKVLEPVAEVPEEEVNAISS